ncbi:MAG: EutN/CcmL family microcompartment protein [Planctomycetota bacterium]
MNLATVIGTIWATRRHPTTTGLTLQLIRPEDAAGNPIDRPIAAADSVGAGPGERVFYVTAREATIPLPPSETPIDATIVGIVEGIEESE